MDKNHLPEASTTEEPKGDLGHGHKTWRPDQGEQGISNRPDDASDLMPDGDESSDAGAFNPSEGDDE